MFGVCVLIVKKYLSLQEYRYSLSLSFLYQCTSKQQHTVHNCSKAVQSIQGRYTCTSGSGVRRRKIFTFCTCTSCCTTVRVWYGTHVIPYNASFLCLLVVLGGYYQESTGILFWNNDRLKIFDRKKSNHSFSLTQSRLLDWHPIVLVK